MQGSYPHVLKLGFVPGPQHHVWGGDDILFANLPSAYHHKKSLFAKIVEQARYFHPATNTHTHTHVHTCMQSLTSLVNQSGAPQVSVPKGGLMFVLQVAVMT